MLVKSFIHQYILMVSLINVVHYQKMEAGLMMKDHIFREYDVRGKVGSELFVDEVYNLTCAIAYYMRERNPSIKTIAVGMDGRVHSPEIKDEMIRALTDSGLDVLFVGVCPSPALYFSLHTEKVDGGLMITASHNGKEYNGIKMCLGTQSIWGDQIRTIKKLYHEGAKIDASSKGTVANKPIVPLYIDWLADHFNDLKGMKRSVVIDCGNGAAGSVIPDLVTRMQWDKALVLYPEVDGTYPNHDADPTLLKNMKDVKEVLEQTDASVGVGLDGDCDRMVPMTKQGELVSGDKLLALFAQPIIQQNPGAGVVFDIKGSGGLIELIEKWGGVPVMSPSGHSIIKDIMLQNNALLGGELSCHFFFHDIYFGYDDGIYAMLRLFRLLDETGKSLAELLKVFPEKHSSQELRLYCPDDKKKDAITDLKAYFKDNKDVELSFLDGIRVAFSNGWALIRSSNTQPALSMRFEADTKEDLRAIMKQFQEPLRVHLNSEGMQAFDAEMGG